MRPGFSIAYASRREAFGGEAMNSSGHRVVPPKKSGKFKWKKMLV